MSLQVLCRMRISHGLKRSSSCNVSRFCHAFMSASCTASAQSSLLRSMDQLIWNISRSYFSASA